MGDLIQSRNYHSRIPLSTQDVPMKHSSRVLLLLILVAACRAFAQDTEKHQGHEVKAHQVLFRLGNPSSAVLQRLSLRTDADDFRALSPNLNLYVLHSKSLDVAGLLSLLKNEPGVVYIEPDYV